jgi:hypothetical protein
MRGTYEGINGLSIEFYPDSAIVGCGKVARAYAYTVRANGTQAVIKIDDPVHPMVLSFKADGELDPGQGQFEVRGRTIKGTDSQGHYTFAPVSATCNLETLAAANVPPPPAGKSSPTVQSAIASAASAPASADSPSRATRSGSVSAPSTSNSATTPPARSANGGNAILVINSGLSAQPGAPNPLANHPYVLLRESFATVMQKAGIAVPAGMSPYKLMGNACGTRSADCQKIMAAVNADAASAVRADVTGKGAFPAVAAGTYYLMISARYNNQSLVWDMPVQLKAGGNTLILDQANASVVK